MTRDLLNWLILGLVVVIAGWFVYDRYQETRPCVVPVEYAVGAVDPRFELSNAALIKNTETAAAIWNTAAGKVVLRHNPEAKLKINLIYDEREATARLGLAIARQQAEEDQIREALDAAQDRFTAMQDAYNTKVETINARGGASKFEATELERERKALQALAATINTQVATYNARVEARNAVIEEYNQSAGRTYEEGQYVRDAAGERVNIFVYVDSTQLTRVLAHEFGHAIGLEHNDDPKAIMYAKNESGNLKPSATDLADLKALCKV